jgi:HD domain
MIGDYKWGLKTQGNLNLLAKIYFSYEAIKARYNSKHAPRNTLACSEKNFTLPDSNVVNQTVEFLKDTHQGFLINHCFRTYIFGITIGENESIKVDRELLAIASLLHDVGLSNSHFKSVNCNCFAIRGAIEAGLFLTKENLDKEKIKVVQDAISLHLNIKVPKELPEAYLLNKGAAVDVIGLNLKRFEATFLTSVLKKYPRLNFKMEIQKLMKLQGEAGPHSRISFLNKHGFSDLISKSAFHD